MVDEASLTPEFLDRLDALAEIEILEDRALVTVVGQGVSRNPSNFARASQRLRRMPGGAIAGWCSDSRFAFVVAAEVLKTAAGTLHEEFFGQPDPAFFVPDRATIAGSLQSRHYEPGTDRAFPEPS